MSGGLYPRSNGDLAGGPYEIGVAAFRVPESGEFFPAVVMREQEDVVCWLELRRNGEVLGRAEGDFSARLPWRHTQYSAEPGREVLHFVDRAVRFEAGDSFEIVTRGSKADLVKDSGMTPDEHALLMASELLDPSRRQFPLQGVHFHSPMLLRERPSAPPLAISNLECVLVEGLAPEGNRRLMVAWTTNRPARCRVTTVPSVTVFREDFDDFENNHRVELLVPDGLDQLEGHIVAEEEPTPEFSTPPADADFSWKRESDKFGLGNWEDVPLEFSGSFSGESGPVAFTGGVPLRQGAAFDAGCIGLSDGEDRLLPLQKRVLSRWPADGSIQWLLLDGVLNANFDSRAKARLVGRTGEANGPSIDWRREGNTLIVNTGAARFEVGGSGCQLRSSHGCGWFELHNHLAADSRRGLESLTIEDAGPQRLGVCLVGTFEGPAGLQSQGYQCRMHFFAGSDRVKIEFTFECRDWPGEPQPPGPRGTNIGFRFTPPDPRPEMNLLRNLEFCWEPAHSFEALQTEIGVLQEGDSIRQIEEAKSVSCGEFSGSATGWCFAGSGDGSGMALLVPRWRELYPKGFRRSKDRIILEILPELPADTYNGYDEETRVKLFFWHREGQVMLRRGLRFTTEFELVGLPSVADAPAALARAQSPVFPLASPAHYCESGVFGRLEPSGQGPLGFFRETQRRIFENHHRSREKNREFGFLNFGDWHGERKYNWGNCEYDTGFSLFSCFAVLGGRSLLDAAVAACAHNADIDVKHLSPDPNLQNTPYTHCIGHTGGYVEQGWNGADATIAGGRSGDRGHTWVAGTFLAYGLTGCERFRETAEGVSETLAKTVSDFSFYNERNAGWPMIDLGYAHTFTGLPFFRNAQRLIRNHIVSAQHPTRGLWGARLNPLECLAPGPWCHCWGAKPFITAILLTALKRTLEADPDPEVEACLVRGADFLWRETFVEEEGKFVYSQCQSYQRDKTRLGGGHVFPLGGTALLYAQRIAPTERGARCLPKAIATFLGEAEKLASADASWLGKNFGNYQILLPELGRELETFGITDLKKYVEEHRAQTP